MISKAVAHFCQQEKKRNVSTEHLNALLTPPSNEKMSPPVVQHTPPKPTATKLLMENTPSKLMKTPATQSTIVEAEMVQLQDTIADLEKQYLALAQKAYTASDVSNTLAALINLSVILYFV